MLRWWPPLALAAMALLGVAVGKGTTPVDGWFQSLGDRMGWWRGVFLAFTYPPLVAVVLAGAVVVAVRRKQWWLTAALVVSPPLAVVVARVCKQVFGREKGGTLAYPSGHTTFLVVVMALLVIVAGAAMWAVIVAVGVSVLGMFGQAISYHYFTDTLGAVLLATAVAAVAALGVGVRRPAPWAGEVLPGALPSDGAEVGERGFGDIVA